MAVLMAPSPYESNRDYAAGAGPPIDGRGRGQAAIAVTAARPYESSREHLSDALARIDQLVRAQTVRWRLAIAQNKPEELWGMVHVSDKEVDSFLRAPYLSAWQQPAEVAAASEPFEHKALELETAVQERVAATPGVTLRLHQLQRMFDLQPVDLDILLIALLPELDGRYRRLYGYLQDDASRTKPVVELVARIVTGDPAVVRTALEPTGRLVSHRLVSMLDDRVDEPLSMRPVRIDDRIAAYLLDGDSPDAALNGVVSR